MSEIFFFVFFFGSFRVGRSVLCRSLRGWGKGTVGGDVEVIVKYDWCESRGARVGCKVGCWM